MMTRWTEKRKGEGWISGDGFDSMDYRLCHHTKPYLNSPSSEVLTYRVVVSFHHAFDERDLKD